MFLARDRDRFAKELQSRANGAAKKANEASGDDKLTLMASANQLLEEKVGPLLEAYTEMVRKAGRNCEFKILPGSAESYPTRAAVAEFWLDLTEVPGVSQYFMRFESVGGDWLLISRPGLGRRTSLHESSEMVLSAGNKLPQTIEGMVQQFIRIVF